MVSVVCVRRAVFGVRWAVGGGVVWWVVVAGEGRLLLLPCFSLVTWQGLQTPLVNGSIGMVVGFEHSPEHGMECPLVEPCLNRSLQANFF